MAPLQPPPCGRPWVTHDLTGDTTGTADQKEHFIRRSPSMTRTIGT